MNKINKLHWKIKNRILTNNNILLAEGLKTDLLKENIIKLRTIHNDKEVSIELILLFLSQFTGTVFAKQLDSKNYVSLNSVFLRDNYGKLYSKIIKFLLDNDYIYIYKKHITNKQNRYYKLNDKYLKFNNYKTYILKNKRIIKLKHKITLKAIERAEQNDISRFTLIMYSLVQLPTTNFLLKKSKELVKNKQSKKGKEFKIRGKKSKQLDYSKYRYIEDDIKLYKFLTEPSMFIPSDSINAGGRVTHSLNLCPTWIRKEIKMKGENIIELDFFALHPNIASSLYGEGRVLNHEIIAKELNTTKNDIKIEHLSFFNKEVYQMKQSILWNFYERYEPEMLNNIVKEKYNKGYKETTKRLFSTETNLMRSIMIKLANLHIYPIYVYDALYVNKSDELIARTIMNETAKEFKINSIIK